MPGPTLEQALDGLTDEQKKMLVGLTPDEVVGARRGPVTEGKFGAPDVKVRTDIPAAGARGTADAPTIPAPAENVDDPTPLAKPALPPAPAPVVASIPRAAPVGRTRAAPPENSTPPSDRDEDGARIEPVQVAPTAPAAEAPPAGPYQNPAVAAYMADRAARMAELKTAQDESARAMLRAKGENAISSAFTTQSDASRAANLEAARQPVADVLARQKAGDEALGEASKLQEFTRSAEAADPKAPANLAFRQFYKQMNINLPEGITLANGGKLAEDFLKREKDQQDNARAIAIDERNRSSAEGIAARHEAGENYRAGQKLQIERNTKPLPDADTKELNAIHSEGQAIEEQRAAHHAAGGLAAVGDFLHLPTDRARAVEGTSGTVAAGKMPGTRGPTAVKKIEAEAPKAYVSDKSADVYYNQMQQDRLRREEQRVSSLEAAHPDHPQVRQARAQLDADKQAFAQRGAGQRRPGPDGRMREKGADGQWHLVQ